MFADLGVAPAPPRRSPPGRAVGRPAGAPRQAQPGATGLGRGAATDAPSQTGRRVAPLRPWVSSQATNVERHLAALRPFTRAEFGAGAATPSEGHILAVNRLLETLRRPLRAVTGAVRLAAEAAGESPTQERLVELLKVKSRAHDWVRATERVWDFYLELFGQRQSKYADWLLGCDRIALDCYQYAYLGLGVPRSIPAPPPFSYMRTGFSPATYRRGIPLRRLGRQLNPFPLVQLPYHRLVNPWTLGAVLHEISHNLQNDLGLQRAVPRSIARRLLDARLPRDVVAVWTRWNRESFADLSGLLLGGPAFVGSLFDVIGRDPAMSLHYSPDGPHPTPYLRAFLSIHLLRRMGFGDEATGYERLWRSLYPNARGSSIPPVVLRTASRTVPLVVDAIAGTRFPSLGDRTLSQVLRFERKEQAMVEEAADRLARGVDPGVVPERFLIGAVRVAVEQGRADPETLMRNFFLELARR
ncbi:hypothetical protein [Rugosimonospora africana]|uniref:Uncharacterized protein n=1 Tax=Rugosimonospora africana TaxID=556532 RepID=A0A8J3QU94_9ACTN|nr:hypothetical protein [Rugosimonospora africana]GIH15905.1 hypothetical protein Raf01_40770 [Rugosimonospora africana]